MTRRDIIIVATLVNAGLLAILFMLATNSDDEKINDPVEVTQTVLEIKPSEMFSDTLNISSVSPGPGDEVDNALKDFAVNGNQQQIIIDDDAPDEQQDLNMPLASAGLQSPSASVSTPTSQDSSSNFATEKSVAKSDAKSDKTVDVTVKRGDSLDRIAKANGTTIQAIRDANQLKNDRLSIGQVLHVPTSSGSGKVASAEKSLPSATKNAASAKTDSKLADNKSTDSKAVPQGEVQYYTVKSGDNPWKIAKQFRIKLDDLLKLNNLNEEKARNMKVGDRIRVK